ncbi:NUDIX domain-containing protein [Halalkaliarchaeum sp. AArc-GB]|uniref:NUDIX hydrolase n=1 Tax=Halalkaliarchaeum sp. AArc-GB TaxID=3074078 RepID=UPI0028581B57|nr:NUDIX domain-containing protein [Halalkaliarchaeum sp. AArc-GB]MDR5673003.1 NUDIX domain-containing protein [Halalkaliarchaeum sp. AArc-GB]
MTSIDDLWFLSDNASQRAEQAAHQLRTRYDNYLRKRQSRRVTRYRFRTLAERIRLSGAPYGAHTIVHREGGDVLLVRHDGIDQWVLPGGEVDRDETFREAAKRELAEEAGIEAEYEGLALLVTVEIESDGHETWGVMPIFEAQGRDEQPEIDDPDGEISDARWFTTAPPESRDRPYLNAWRQKRSE